MNQRLAKRHAAVRRNQVENYILISLICFAVTVIITRAFLQLTGFPQIGNSVLHIAHALWGGLLLIVAAYLPLVFANRWVFQASAVLSGIGIGLFIDEIGKFITQANDYFFPPALPLIYSFILLNALVYLYFRHPRKANTRCAMYHVLDGLQDVVDGDIDETKMALLKNQLTTAKQSNRNEIVSLANAMDNFLRGENIPMKVVEPNLWQRFVSRVDEYGLRFGRQKHRALISGILIGWVFFVAGYIAVIIQRGTLLDPDIFQWRTPLIVVQVIVGILISCATYFWLIQKEEPGIKFGIIGFLVSLVALQLLYFYLSQFLAITITLLQVSILLVLITYRSLYLKKDFVI